jgi:hypothetical protein
MHHRERRKEGREDFFNTEVPNLLPNTPTDTVLAGDFNSILENNDSKGSKNFSRTLACMVKNLGFHDVWQTSDRTTGFTNYGIRTASRLDRIYVTKIIRTKERSGKFGDLIFGPPCSSFTLTNRYTASPSWTKLLENERVLSTGKQLAKWITYTMGKVAEA